MGRLLGFAMAALTLTGVGLFEEAHAIDLSGAWAADADQCSKVFIRHGRAKQIGFTALSSQHGGGFIIDADRLRGKSISCKIKSKREEEQTLNIIAACASDIMLSNVQFTLKVLGPNRIARVFPGIDDMAINYHRCPI